MLLFTKEESLLGPDWIESFSGDSLEMQDVSCEECCWIALPELSELRTCLAVQ